MHFFRQNNYHCIKSPQFLGKVEICLIAFIWNDKWIFILRKLVLIFTLKKYINICFSAIPHFNLKEDNIAL
jgi:hypothetical protein